MSLKRSTLEAMGLTAQQIDTIIADHTETVTAIQKERDVISTPSKSRWKRKRLTAGRTLPSVLCSRARVFPVTRCLSC